MTTNQLGEEDPMVLLGGDLYELQDLSVNSMIWGGPEVSKKPRAEWNYQPAVDPE